MHQLAPFIMMIALFIVIAYIIVATLNYSLKSRIIKTGPLDENALKFLTHLTPVSKSGFGPEVLKWGLILFFGGIGLVVLEYLPYKADESSLPYGIEAIFLAIAFLLYYVISKREKEKQY